MKWFDFNGFPGVIRYIGSLLLLMILGALAGKVFQYATTYVPGWVLYVAGLILVSVGLLLRKVNEKLSLMSVALAGIVFLGLIFYLMQDPDFVG